MFESLRTAPADPILGLTELFALDANPQKINLGVGVYKDADGNTPILASVKRAEQKLVEESTSKAYLPIPGHSQFWHHTQALLFGKDHEVVRNDRARTAHTPGGTGALRVAADFVGDHFPDRRAWLSTPTWANHAGIFRRARVETAAYAYYDGDGKDLDLQAMLASLEAAAEGDLVLLHGACHNPTGIDPDGDQWNRIGTFLNERHLLPIVDLAYQGFGNGIDEDAAGLRTVARHCPEMIVCNSYSKNFGLYNDRVGAMTLVAGSAAEVERAFSNVKPVIRANYSTPPAHGAAVVSLVLDDPALRSQWEAEVAGMRARIHRMRHLFVEEMVRRDVTQDFSFITRQNGMFSFSGLNREQVTLLRERYSIYIVDSGRINVAGMTGQNMGYLCDAIAAVL